MACCLNQCRNIVNSNLRNKLQWNLKRNSCIFIQENAFENVVCEKASILSGPQCVKTWSHINATVNWVITGAGNDEQVTRHYQDNAPFGPTKNFSEIRGGGWSLPIMPVNSLAPGRFERNLRKVIFKLILMIRGCGIFCKIALRGMSMDFTDDVSTLVQVIAWCRQCWPRSMSQYGVTRPQCVNINTIDAGFIIRFPFDKRICFSFACHQLGKCYLTNLVLRNWSWHCFANHTTYFLIINEVQLYARLYDKQANRGQQQLIPNHRLGH